MMLEAVERRFGSVRAPHPVEHLSDNGSPYTAKETRDFATALNLVSCFTPVKSPESKRNVQGLREDLQARLPAHISLAGRTFPATADRRLNRRLQRDPSSLSAPHALLEGIHPGSAPIAGVSSETGGTPAPKQRVQSGIDPIDAVRIVSVAA